MKRSTKIVVIVVVVAALVGAVTVEALTSQATSPCQGVSLTPSAAAPAATPVAAPAALAAPGALPTAPTGEVHAAAGAPIKVVAAENFWGSLVAQLGGNLTSVLSIVTDPNADPHEYEANVSTAEAIAAAQYIIVNGVGYDDWALQLIAADGSTGQIVLNVGNLNGVSVTGGIVTGNPHMWYNPVYVNRTVAAMYQGLLAVEQNVSTNLSAAIAELNANYAALNASLGTLYGEAYQIRAHFAGTEVAATESIFVYLANYTDLDLVSPPEFMEAVAEGNDPTPQSELQFECQLESGQVKLLVYNEQTVTPITTTMKSVAAQNNVTVVGVTETIQPPQVDGVNTTFQAWMGAEYLQIYNGLNANVLGQ